MLLVKSNSIRIIGTTGTTHDTVELRQIQATGNVAQNSGGAVSINGEANVTIIGGSYNLNRAQNGGAIFVLGGAVVTGHTGPTFVGNTATNNGGAIWTRDSRTTLFGAIVRGNTANNNGGGFFVGAGGRFLSLIDTVVIGNIASQRGGGAYNARLLFSSGSVWVDNIAGTTGGAVYGAASSASRVLDDLFAGNLPNNTAGPGTFTA